MGWVSRLMAWREILLYTRPVEDVVEVARSRFLAGLFLFYEPLVLGVGAGVLAPIIRPATPHLTLTFGGTLLTAIAISIAYVLNRRGARIAAERLFVFFTSAMMVLVPIEHAGLLYFASVVIISTTALLPTKQAVGLACAMIVASHGLPLILGTAAFADVVPPLCLNLFVLPMCIAQHLHNRILEELRFDELARRKNWSATVLRSIGDGVLTCDEGRRLMFLNPVAEALTGWSMAEAKGRPLEQVFSIIGEGGMPAESPASIVLQQGAAVNLNSTATLIARDGTRRPITYNGAPLTSPEGSLLGVVLAFKDVSAEHALQARLRHSQRLEALGQLAGGVAHDFNNLLTVMAGSGTMALEQLEEDHPAYVELQYVLDATKRAVAVTSQLLAFSRRQVMQPRAVELNAALTELCPILRRLLREHVRIEVDLAGEAGYVMVDPVQLEQVVLNLAINAGDAMPKGGSLTLSTTRVVVSDEAPLLQLRPGAYARLRVSDDGVGMDEDTQSRMFEPFFTTKLRGRGTGLGLSTVYGIVQQTGGTVSVRSAPLHGTAIDVFLPCTEAPANTLTSTAGSSPAVLAAHTILVVEDDPMVRRLVALALGKAGHRVMDADSGEAAIAMIEAGVLGQPDLLITDVVMSGASGVQVAERFVSLYPAVPVLFMSGYANEVLANQGVRRAETAFLAKPFTPPDLLKAVERLLRERRSRAQPGAA